MAALAFLIGVVLLVSTIRNTHGALMGALLQDVPAFAVWGAAIFGIAVIGFIPGLKPVSRGLLGLIIMVILLNNYQQILGAFTGVAAQGAAAQTKQASTDETKIADSWDMLKQLGQIGGVDFSDLLDTSNSERVA